MAKINVSAKWDVETQEYVPDIYTIIGTGPIVITLEFVNSADPRWFRVEGNIIQFGPYKLEILERDEHKDRITCKLLGTV